MSITLVTYANMQWLIAPAAVPLGYNQHATEIIKKAINIPVFCVGRFNISLWLKTC